jgi:hypothetical protein
MGAEEPLVAVFVPPLVDVIRFAEDAKGEPLTEAEVAAIRDQAVCITMRQSHAQALESKRGYPDLDPENAWQEWQAIRSELMPGHEQADE